MKKNFLRFLIITILALAITACSESDYYDSNYDEDYEDYESDYGEDYSDEEYEEVESEETVVATYPFTKLRPFSEGRAWVDFNADGVTCTGVIDTDGRLIYQADGQLFYVSPFQDGLAFYREDNTEESPCGIIDSKGNVLFKSQISTDGGYLILAYGNGHFFAAQHIRSFDTDEWRYGTIDKDGNILNKMKASDDDFTPASWIDSSQKCSFIQYIGGNFIVLPSGLYNISTTYFSPFPGRDIEQVVGNFYEGYTSIVIKNGYYFAYIIDVNYEENIVSKTDNFFSDSRYGEGLIFGRNSHTGAGYYDKDWNLAISLGQYKDVRGGAFSEGYAAITMTGVDGDSYASVIDRQGNLLYSPVRIDGANPDNSANGYLQATIDNEIKIIGPDGTIYTPEIDDLSALENLTFGDISEGFILMESNGNGTEPGYHYYVSLNGSNIIDSAKLTSEYIDDNSSENDDSEQNSSEEDSTTSSYIMPDSYDIIGKWKNIGDKGFGQAQPGAIVIFNGNHCNFYSPNDTYASYHDGNKYVLDVTSPLAESLSFTVNIIDDNNISISGTNLERIE